MAADLSSIGKAVTGALALLGGQVSAVDVGPNALDSSGFMLEFYHVPTKTTSKFSGYLTSFDDKYEANWNQEDVFGRMDPLQIYQGTKRVISIAWDVPSSGEKQAKKNFLEAMNLIKMLYPRYEARSGAEISTTMTSAPLFKVKFANLITNMKSAVAGGKDGKATAATSGLLGVIPSLSYTPDFNSGFFSDGNGFIYPQTIKMNAQIHVLHTHALGWWSESGQDFKGMSFPYLAKGGVVPDKDSTGAQAFDFGGDDDSSGDIKTAIASERMTT